MAEKKNVVEFTNAHLAREVPRMDGRIAWWLFSCAGVLILAMLTMLAVGRVQPAHQIVALGLVALTFVWAGTYAVIAATTFDGRQKAILGWIAEALKEAPEHAPSQPVISTDCDKDDDWLMLEVRDAGMDTATWEIVVKGAFHTEPYRAVEMTMRGDYALRDYVDLLRAETHRARMSAASLAGAFGGLTVVGFQLFRALALAVPG